MRVCRAAIRAARRTSGGGSGGARLAACGAPRVTRLAPSLAPSVPRRARVLARLRVAAEGRARGAHRARDGCSKQLQVAGRRHNSRKAAAQCARRRGEELPGAAAQQPNAQGRGRRVFRRTIDVRSPPALTRVAAAPKRLPGRAACPPPRAWRVCRPRGWPARAAGARCPRPPPCGAAAAQRRSASSPPPPLGAAVRRPAVPAAASSARNSP